MYPDDCERCELIARIKHLETSLQRLMQSMWVIRTWASVARKDYQHKPREWWIKEVIDIEHEADRAIKVSEKERIES